MLDSWGVTDEAQAALILRRLPVFRDAVPLALDHLVQWIRDLYPSDGGVLQPAIFLLPLVTGELGAIDHLDELLDGRPVGLP